MGCKPFVTPLFHLSFPGRLAGNATNRTTNILVCLSAVPFCMHSLHGIQNVCRTSCTCGGTGQTVADPLPPPPSLCVRFMPCPFPLRLIDNDSPVFPSHIHNAEFDFCGVHRDITALFRHKHPPWRLNLCAAVFAQTALQRCGAVRTIGHSAHPFAIPHIKLQFVCIFVSKSIN